MFISCSSDLGGGKQHSDCLSDRKKTDWGNLIGWSNKPDQHGLTKFVALPRPA